MKYALINGQKTEASKGVKGYCPICNSELVARCGEIKIHHWAHKSERNCDPWWENETDWHRTWKNRFPSDWQEVVQFADNGEKHIADVKTESGWVFEFQHSYIKPEERRSRNNFYQKLVWIVDGLRRKNDIKQFKKVLNDSIKISSKPLVFKVYHHDECRIINEWCNSNVPVCFDFGDNLESGIFLLWYLFPNKINSEIYLMCISCDSFLKFHMDGDFDEFMDYSDQLIRNQKKSSLRNKNSYRRANQNYSQRSKAFK